MSTTKGAGFSFRQIQLGVWNVNFATPNDAFWWTCHRMTPTAVILHQTLQDLYSLSPSLCWNILLCIAWEAVDGALTLRFENALMRKIESGYVTGTPDISGIIFISVAHLSMLILTSYLYCVRHRLMTTLRTRTGMYYDARLLRARLGRNLPIDDTDQSSTNGEDVANAILSLIRHCTWALSFAVQIVTIVNLSRTAGGPMFLTLALVHPAVSILLESSDCAKPYLAKLANQYDKRLRDLASFAKEKRFRRDIVTGGLVEWILQEYSKAAELQGSVPRAQPQNLFSQSEDAFSRGLKTLFAQSSSIYVATCAILNSRSFTLASNYSVHASASIIQNALRQVFIIRKEIEEAVRALESVTSEEDRHMATLNHGRSYPPITLSKAQGMSFELQNVSFSYPGSKSTFPALQNVTVSIKSGQIVVLVGQNGCGKSTLVRMLARMYDPTSGDILIDNEPIASYKLEDLRRASAVLSQENELYPLSLFENIALGLPDCPRDVKAVKDAAKKAGAWSVVGKLDRGLDTEVIGVGHYSVLSNVPSDDSNHPLRKKQEELEKNLDLSSGEKQRVVAARTFMSLSSSDVKFVVVDEPSSALDAEAELRLFQNLIANREGKTMVFITHHFGHITKYADQIICMKNGMVVETGSHAELMLAKGEYAKLYDIQALSFQHSSSN